jgi:activator of HSP90 ATPase
MTAHIHQEVVLDATPHRIFQAYMDSAQHAAFTGRPADMGTGAGDAFSCHDGQISGRNIEIGQDALIVQAWRVASWEPGQYSLVHMELKPEGSGTRVVLDHAGVPAEAKEHIEGGWGMMYWEPLKKHLTEKA